MTDALVAFLAARYDEEEAALERIDDRSEPWRGQWEIKNGTLYTYNGWCLAVIHRDYPWNPNVLAHIVRYDPARVLADIAMKRRLVEAYPKLEQRLDEIRKNDPMTYSYGHAKYAGLREAAEAVLLQFASLYAEHPDFDPAWRIDA